MSRESNQGHVCPACDTVIWREECACLDQELLFCQHAGEKKINLSTAMLECAECDEPIFDLNPQLSPVLRVERA